MIAALKSKGVPVLWVGAAVYGTKSTSDMSYLDEIFRARAERAASSTSISGTASSTKAGATSPKARISRPSTLRTGDGVHSPKPAR